MASAALLLPRTVGDTVSAHGHIAAMQAETILRELSEARDDHQLRALVLRACAALYEASAGASRARLDTERRLEELRAEYDPTPPDGE